MLTVEMTSIPASSSASMSCQRFSWRDPGHVGVGQLVDERDVRAPGQQGVEVHLLERDAAVLDRARGTTSRPSTMLRRVLAPVRLDQADNDIGAAVVPAAALIEHRDGLADPGGRPEVDAMPTACHGLILTTAGGGLGGFEGDVELGDVDPVLADEAQRRVLGVCRDQPLHLFVAQSSGRRDPWHLVRGVRRGDVRVEPAAGCRERISGDVAGAPGLASRRAASRSPPRWRGPRSSGRGWTRRCVAGVVGCRGSGLEPLRTDGGLAEQAGADDLAVDLDEGAVGRVGHHEPDGQDRRWVEHTEQDGEGEKCLEGCEELASDGHGDHLSPGKREMTRSMSLMPTNGATRPPRP